MCKESMELPKGKTCSDCIYYSWCIKLFGCDPNNTTCDWAPSRFIQKRDGAR